MKVAHRTSRRFAVTDAGEEFYRHAVVMLRDAGLAESDLSGTRTGLFVPDFDRLYVAVRARSDAPAAIWVFKPV